MKHEKIEELILIRQGKPIFAVKVPQNKEYQKSMYLYMRDTEPYFESDHYFKDLGEYNPNEESHAIAKEIFISQLNVSIRNKILELKQLESIFKEIGISDYIGSTIQDNSMLLADVKSIVEKSKQSARATAREAVKKITEEKIKDLAKEAAAEEIEVKVRPIARKKEEV